jgi:DNA-binding Lrp family transcriptional regulator
MLATKTRGVLETLREQARVGRSPSWLEMMMDYKLSVSSLARILRKLEFDGQIVRRCGHGNVRNKYIIKDAQNEP